MNRPKYTHARQGWIGIGIVILGLIVLTLVHSFQDNPSDETTYAELDFSVELPQGWMESDYRDHLDYQPNYIFGAVDIVFSNIPQPEEGYDITNTPAEFEAIQLRVFDMDNTEVHNSRLSDYKEEFLPRLDALERGKDSDRGPVSGDVEITKYLVKNDSEMTLYVYTTEATYDSHAVTIADAFYRGERFAYEFSAYIDPPDDESTEQLIEMILKPILSSFKDLSTD